jgi:hypothetical protein
VAISASAWVSALISPLLSRAENPQSCRFRDSDCFVEGAMIAPSINDNVLLKEEQP